ncbi:MULTISPECIES: helix-turn-helix domain-containing protein [Lactobacillus]|uniref:XRE family transcriptional regulator n=1 Tax=Lactobacillus xujianguonis TaxID=2495899 RepID=A0A437SSC5_9LACO|nr:MULTISPECIES: helix-turn-helix transcriptional regulator [Lactobacillus]RVU69836.1 XRE family transcriptional regulator [Lactobacillus xujianguonis]RVU77445.1 XRE family transcriptional regulator [Lactobacillus xujianguonis]
MSVFSERLTTARKAMGWTRKRAVSEFSLPYQTYSNYEQGKREPDINTMKRLAYKLNTTTDYLTGAVDNPAPASVTSSDLEDMLNDAHSYDGKPMDEHDRALIKQYLEALFSQRDAK